MSNQISFADVIAQNIKSVSTNSILSNKQVERFNALKKIISVYSLYECPLTDREVAKALGVHKSEVQPRITELLQAGQLRSCEDTHCEITGKLVRTLTLAWKK